MSGAPWWKIIKFRIDTCSGQWSQFYSKLHLHYSPLFPLSDVVSAKTNLLYYCFLAHFVRHCKLEVSCIKIVMSLGFLLVMVFLTKNVMFGMSLFTIAFESLYFPVLFRFVTKRQFACWVYQQLTKFIVLT